MKTTHVKAAFLSLLFFFAFNFTTTAQSFENIVNGFKTGDASLIAKNFEGNVEITIKTGTTSYSKSQAEMVLKNFFASHKPKSFVVAHEGTSPQGSKYFIGNLNSSAGNYRTYVYAKTVKNELTIQEIRFEEE